MSFPRYPEYKDSGVEWLDELPAGWSEARVRWLATVFAGGTPDKRRLEFWNDGTIPWLNSGCVNQGYIVAPSAMITDEGFLSSSAKWVPRNSLVIALAGQGKTKGMVAQLGIEATCNQSMAAIVPGDQIDARYLYWWLVSNYQNIRNLAGGDLRDGLNLELLGSIGCPLPSKHEQLTIAAFLDHETARIDALVAEQQRLIELLKEKRQAVISHAVTKGLDPDVPMKDSGVAWLGAVPAHWQVRRLKDCGSLLGGTGFPHAYQNQPNKCVAFYKVGDLGKSPDGVVMPAPAHTIDRTEATKLGAQIIPEDSIVWAKIGAALLLNRRRVTPYPACLDNNMTAYVPDELYLSSNWAYYWTSQLDFSQFVQGGAVPSLSEGYQSTLPLILPSLEEQASITAAIDHEVDYIDRLIKEARAGIGLLKERRSALISAAVTGKIDVRGWQPPAGSSSPTEATATETA